MTSVNAYGNTWVDPVSATAADLQAQQSRMSSYLATLGRFCAFAGEVRSRKISTMGSVATF